MASGDKYALQDPLDEFLAKDISTYVSYVNFSDFANHLRVPQRELERINEQTSKQDERVKRVSATLFTMLYPDSELSMIFLFNMLSNK